MAVLADVKTVGPMFGNAQEIVRVTYDFAVDGGSIADYDVLVAGGDVIVELMDVDVKKAVTSSDAVVIDLGKGAGGVDFWSDVVKGNLTLDAQVPSANEGRHVELSSGEKIVLGVESFAITAGSLQFIFKCYSRQP